MHIDIPYAYNTLYKSIIQIPKL